MSYKKRISFSHITYKDISSLVNIKQIIEDTVFHEWFDYPIFLTSDEEAFLDRLLSKHKRFLNTYSEEELKTKFIAPILNQVDFMTETVRDWYDRPLQAVINGTLLKGNVDYMVAKGIEEPERPYFFIQEFKKSRGGDVDPKNQLLAEMLVALKLNKEFTMRGAYIIGSIWNFTTLQLEDTTYTYVVSSSFDSLRIRDLQAIYKNLQAVKPLFCED